MSVKFQDFEHYPHFCQWVKTMSKSSKDAQEIEKSKGVILAWRKLAREGECEIDPSKII